MFNKRKRSNQDDEPPNSKRRRLTDLEKRIIKYGPQIGGGKFAFVHKKFCESEGVVVAYKVGKSGTSEELMHEINILNELKHPNIVDMLAFRKTSLGEFVIKLELMETTLYKHFFNFYQKREQNRKNLLPYRLSIDELQLLCQQIGGALAYMHDEMLILHADIKCDNITANFMLSEFKLIDFGTSLRMPEGVAEREFYTSTLFMPPECTSSDQITFSADVYSFGCVLYECVTGSWYVDGKIPLMDSPMLNENDTIRIYPKFIDLVDECLHENPLDRVSANDIRTFQLR